MSPTVTRARDLEGAVSALRDATPSSRLLAGGTDLLLELRSGRSEPDLVVDLWAVEELRSIHLEANGLRLGALTTCTDLLHDDLVQTHADLLAQASRVFGATQIRNRATLGGNLGTASPAADLNPVLLALGATVRLVSAQGQRDLPVAAFLTGYRETARRPDELIHSVWIPPRKENEHRAFRKVGTRAAQSIAKVVVALAVRYRGEEIESLCAAAGSVAERTILLPTLATELVGRIPTQERICAAARATALRDCSPIDDVRSSAVYRRRVLERILARLLPCSLPP